MNTQTKTYDKEQVYTEYYPKVLRYVENRSSVRMDAEDLAQTVFMKVFRKWDAFDPEKSSLSASIFRLKSVFCGKKFSFYMDF